MRTDTLAFLWLSRVRRKHPASINLPLPACSFTKNVVHVASCLLATLSPIEALEKLFFALFGQTTLSDLNYVTSVRPLWTQNIFKFVFGGYMLMSVVVLVTLLIAMMSDTYQRIQVQYIGVQLGGFVRSDYEPAVLVWAAVLCGVRSDDHGADPRAPPRQQHAAPLDDILVQIGVRHLHAGVSGGADQPAHCHDVRHVPADPGNARDCVPCRLHWITPLLIKKIKNK